MLASYSKTQFSKEIQETRQSTGTTKNRDLETPVQTSASKALFVAACYNSLWHFSSLSYLKLNASQLLACI